MKNNFKVGDTVKYNVDNRLRGTRAKIKNCYLWKNYFDEMKYLYDVEWIKADNFILANIFKPYSNDTTRFSEDAFILVDDNIICRNKK